MEGLKFREMKKEIGIGQRQTYSVCDDCYREGVEIEPIPIKDVGQWTYLYECPRCHKTCYDIDYIGEKIAGVM